MVCVSHFTQSAFHQQTMPDIRADTWSVTVTPTRVPPIPGHVSRVPNSRLSLSLSPSNSPTITPAVDRSQSVRGDWWQQQQRPGEWEWYQHNPAISMLMTRTGMGRLSLASVQPPSPLLVSKLNLHKSPEGTVLAGNVQPGARAAGAQLSQLWLFNHSNSTFQHSWIYFQLDSKPI